MSDIPFDMFCQFCYIYGFWDCLVVKGIWAREDSSDYEFEACRDWNLGNPEHRFWILELLKIYLSLAGIQK